MIKQREANSWKSVSYAKSITGAQTYTKFPIVLRTTNQSIPTWNVKGNTESSGTPSPSSPITINGVGEKTVNIFTGEYSQLDDTGGTGTLYKYFKIEGNFVLYMKAKNDIAVAGANRYLGLTERGGMADTDRPDSGVQWLVQSRSNISKGTVLTAKSSDNNFQYISMYDKTSENFNWFIDNFDIMVAMGDTIPAYEPFGYKLSILSNGTALTPIYLSNQLMKIGDTVDTLASSGTVTYNIAKYEFTGNEAWEDANVPIDNTYLYRYPIAGIVNVGNVAALDVVCTHFECGSYYSVGDIGVQHSQARLYFRTTESTLTSWKQWLADQYTAGTPVTVYYVLATPTTESVTAPSIPTTSGLNTIDVNTTVKPSEMSLTYNGWRINKQKRKSANLCNGVFEQNGINNAGDLVGAASRVRIFIDVKPNTQYTFNSNEYLRIIYGYNGDNKVGIILDTSENAPKTYTFTTAATVNKIGIALMNNAYSSLATAIVPSDVQNAILNTGSTALPYAPYWE